MYETIGSAVFSDEVAAAQPAPLGVPVRASIALVGGFTPRKCGIATFTADIHDALARATSRLNVDLYAMIRDPADAQFYPAGCATIIENNRASFQEAARTINASGVDAVWLQHEFGLFGGDAGDMIFALLDRIAVPLIVTMHTVISTPDPAQLRVMQRLVARASKIMVMSGQGATLLATVYGASAEQIVRIPHGVPERPFGRSAQFKAKFGFTGKQILMTFGLLSPGKGIENVIAALPKIIADHPDVIYCVVGATHPNLVAAEGEAYRERLHAQASALGVADHVHWIDAFIENEELLDLLEAADIYVTPYPGAAQSTSGTLSYAVALGKAVVSTPYVHAVELLGDDHGVLVPFNDSARIAEAVGSLLEDPDRLKALQQRAYARGRDMIWPKFADRCLAMIEDARVPSMPLPDGLAIGLSGLLRICDDTGILQHSIHSVPDRAHGYCIDDNARALMLMNRLGTDAEPHRSQLATTFAAFVQSAWNADTGQYRNFMDYRRNWLEDVGSEDSCGRTLWALGATALEGDSAALRHWALGLFDRTAPSALTFGSPRAIAFAMLGADYLLRAHPTHANATAILTHGADRLLGQYFAAKAPGWTWFETVLAYDNCRLPEAMIRAGQRLVSDDMTTCGLETMHWIFDQQRAPNGHFRPVGSESFGRRGEGPMPFDQQPVEAWAAIDGASAALDATGDAIWFVHAQRAYDWFGGANDRGVVVADPLTGTCRDGINPRGLNLNEGAESVLAYQFATYAMRALTAKLV
ncbi:MAG: glycosyltransferase family 4 protein [Sphingomonadaceae bacterium]